MKKIISAIENYEMDEIVEYVEEAKAKGYTAKEILDDGLIKGMDIVGKAFGAGDLFVPEVLMAANTMHAGMDVIKEELLAGGDNNSKGTLVIGTVKGDLHDIGKKLVGMMLQGAGFNVIDLGIDVDPEAFVTAVKENDAKFVGMSAMLTTTMTVMETVVNRLKEESLDADCLIGGAPLTTMYADKIGAKYSHDAAGAVELANSLVK